jgi:hypothetical protein
MALLLLAATGVGYDVDTAGACRQARERVFEILDGECVKAGWTGVTRIEFALPSCAQNEDDGHWICAVWGRGTCFGKVGD